MTGTENRKEERRKHPRAKFQETVTVHKVIESSSGNVFEVQGNPIIVKAEDVSEGGIRLEIGETNSPTKILKLNFQLQKNKPVDVYTRLAWTGKGQCGLQFIVLDEEIRRMIQTYVSKKGGI
jgi:hypothetical protein